MPVREGKDKKGHYFAWGKHGHHYYFKKGNKRSEGIQHGRAAKQGRAVKRSQSLRGR